MYILYADDLILCSESVEGLQKLLDGLFEFCRKWHLIVSLVKTNVLIFGKRNPVDKFIFNQFEIKIATQYKYVGTVVSTKTRNMFSKNQDCLVGKCRNAIYALKSYAENSIGKLHSDMAIRMFDAQIDPIMQYASEIWFQNKEMTELQKIHLSYLKNTMRVKPSSSTLAIYSELGRFPILIKQKCQLIKYWRRILKMSQNAYVNKAYNSMYELDDLGQTNWCSFVKDILNEVQLQQCWNSQTMNDNEYCTLKETLHQSYMEQCMVNIKNPELIPKLITFKLFKEELKCETYLIYIQKM